MLLRRLTYPCFYSDLIPRFGRLIPELRMIYNIVLDHIYNTRGHRISQWNNPILDPVNLERYAEAIHDKGAALDNCIGFIDGTVRPICRPGELQRVVYNGHKRVHALKLQSFTLPNGMIANMYGPVGKSGSEYTSNKIVAKCSKPFMFVILGSDYEFAVLVFNFIAEGRKNDSGMLADSGLYYFS